MKILLEASKTLSVLHRLFLRLLTSFNRTTDDYFSKTVLFICILTASVFKINAQKVFSLVNIETLHRMHRHRRAKRTDRLKSIKEIILQLVRHKLADTNF